MSTSQPDHSAGGADPYNRVMNFAAGPSALPLSVLQTVQKELLNWNGTGVSIMEIGHRGADFGKIISEAERDLRELLSIPDEYAVLFMQGGGTGQFAAVPLNLLHDSSEKADYLITGGWSKKAYQEAKKFADVHVVFDGESTGFTSVPSDLTCSADAKYFYFCSNETIHGVEFNTLPIEVKENTPVLVADMSSNFLSRPVNVRDYGAIVAGAQKNAGIAGLVISIVRKDLLKRTDVNRVPTALCYATTHSGKSILNTPPTFAIYVSGLIFKWILSQGGINAIEAANITKANTFYEYIDSTHGFYVNRVQPAFRSRMNIPLRIHVDGTPNAALEATFVQEAAKEGLLSLGGHQSVGGLRVSLYNATPLIHVLALIAFMKKFHQAHSSPSSSAH